MKQPVECPFGTVYDAAVYAECPCPSCWADRSAASLSNPVKQSLTTRARDSGSTGSLGLPAAPDKQGVTRKHGAEFLDGINRGLKQALKDYLRSIAKWRVALFFRKSQPRVDRPKPPEQETTQSLKKKQRARKTPVSATSQVITPRVATFLLALLAIPSALLSEYSPVDPWGFLAFSALRNQPLLPAFYFGLVLCTGVFLWESKSWRNILIVFGSVFVSWICAYQVAYQLVLIVDPPYFSDIPTPDGVLKKYALTIPGLAGGFVGSLGTVLGIAFISPDVRNRNFFLRAILIGTSAGVLLQKQLPSVLLFLVWQPAIAACVAYGLIEAKITQSGKGKVYFPQREVTALIMVGVLIVGAIGLFFRQRVDETAKALARLAGESLTPTEERALKPKDTFKECDGCPEMIVVPPGSFMMGSDNAPPYSDQIPRHRVTLSRPFAVGRFAVTFDEWEVCVADGGCNGYRPSDQGWGRGRRPVINVNWNDAQAYVAWLSSKTGKSYRLLSEAEREYVTRAGTSTPFWWGSSISTSQANYDSKYYNYGSAPKGEYRKMTVPVDSFAPNPWGLYQVYGNIWEWVEDCYNDSYSGAPADGSSWRLGDCVRRVLRGGSWYSLPIYLGSSVRSSFDTVDRLNFIGFRIARELPLGVNTPVSPPF